ncbi:purine catabolism regulatory protein [Thermomonospora echinospora]|uniref:Purine catabolism regulatory protein n=1 Tax=Thermomonospora echinospora TaxID=1992 RepID=A0A1H6EAY1_9ACTN|nr:PucR family transcriptional regulator [Thermomonospora echinospora]SEG94401.1 purine catabolism regulatory protein [Thermomonospora echinospora]
MTVTIRRLLADAGLGLRVVSGTEGLDQPVRWVAVSELPDPTPWLDGAELLLTSGMWLRDEPEPARAAVTWARRLAEAGARAVGFGLDPWFPEIPGEVVQAARRNRLTLIEVPTRTPFVAVDRAVADLNAAEARREAEQAGRLQQRLAEAGHSGRQAVADRLARDLNGWVAVLDPGHHVLLRSPSGKGSHDEKPPRKVLYGGQPSRDGSYRDKPLRDGSYGEEPAPNGPDDERPLRSGPDDGTLAELARRAERGRRHALGAEADGMPVIAVPLGLARERRGTLCVGAPAVGERPAWAASVVGTAAAVLTVLDRGGERELRGVVAMLLAEGETGPAARVAAALDLPLPGSLVAVTITGRGHRELAARVVTAGGWAAADRPSGSVVLVTPGFAEERLAPLLASGRAGLSVPHPPAETVEAIREAETAAALTRPDRRLVRYAETPAMELDRLLASPAAERFASALLAPLARREDGRLLLAAARAWVAANYRWDPAAAAAGVHRETLRARLRRVAELAGLDLDKSADRLALSLALKVPQDWER